MTMYWWIFHLSFRLNEILLTDNELKLDYKTGNNFKLNIEMRLELRPQLK
jgi:hypothetical protein